MRQQHRGAGSGGILVILAVVAMLFIAIALMRRQQPDAASRGAGNGVSRGPSVSAGSSEDPAALRAARPPILPDPTMTPGATLEVTAQDICVPGYSKRVRNVPSAVKRQAYEEYGIATHEPGEYEVDHLISLELGGSNSIRNLWPESFRTQPWNAHTKDKLENELHRLVCAGQLDLATAQQEIAGDWVAAYRRHFGAPTANDQ